MELRYIKGHSNNKRNRSIKNIKKQRAFQKPRGEGGYKRYEYLPLKINIMLQSHNITYETTQYEVEGQTEIFNILLEQNMNTY